MPDAARPLKILLVWDLDLPDVTGTEDAAQQIATLANKLVRVRERDPALRRLVKSLRIGLDDPDPRGPQVATIVLRYLDEADRANDRLVERPRFPS